MNSIKINYFTRSDAEFQIAADIRTAVFTREQGADELGEFDCYDETALFALLYIDSKPAGTARIAKVEKGYKIGRIAILKEYRGLGLGAVIVNAVTEKAFNLGADTVYVDAQNYAVPFYEKLGFRLCGEQLIDRGLPHMPMKIEKGEFYGKEEK